MNCDGVNEWLSEGAPPDSRAGAVRAHVAGCSECQALWGVLAAPLPAPPLVSAGSPSWRAVGAEVVGTAVVTVGLAWIWRNGHGWVALDGEQRLAIACYAAVLLGLLAACFWRLRRPAGIQPVPPGWLLAGTGLGFPLLLWALFSGRVEGPIHEDGRVCLSIGLSVALGTGSLLWLLAQRGFRAERVWLGAVAGAIGGLLGMVALQIVCADQHVAHAVIWHGLTGVIAVAGGAGAGWLAWRRRAC